jgi:CCR4-NOT transcription complex subunit 1
LYLSLISALTAPLKILEALLEVRPFTFALDIASLASRREYLNLDKWLADKVQTSGSDFLRSIIVFLEQKMTAEKQPRLLVSEPPIDTRSLSLSPSTVAIFLRVLRNK